MTEIMDQGIENSRSGIKSEAKNQQKHTKKRKPTKIVGSLALLRGILYSCKHTTPEEKPDAGVTTTARG